MKKIISAAIFTLLLVPLSAGAFNPGTTAPFDNPNPAVTGGDPSGNPAPRVVVVNNSGSGPLRQIDNINDLGGKIAAIANTATYLLVAFAVVFIVWNVVIYIIKPSSPENKAEAGTNIIWGIAGLFVIVSLWGLVNILVNTFGTNSSVPRDRFPSADFVNW